MKNEEHEQKQSRTLKTRLLRALGIGRQRSMPRSTQRNSHRRSEAGNVFFTLFGAVAVVGVLGAGIMSTMRGPLTTMVEVNRIEEAKAQMRVNARLLVGESETNQCTGDTDSTTGTMVEYIEPVDSAAFTGTGSPAGVGDIPGSSGAKATDPWGQPYGYCIWNHGPDNTGCATHLNGEESTNVIVLALISGGPDRQITSSCANAPTYITEGGDDIVVPMTYDAAISASGGLWNPVGPTTAAINRDLDIDGTGTSDFAGNLAVTGTTAFTGASTFGGNITATTGAVITNSIQSITPGSDPIVVSATTLDVNANGDISGTLDVGGAVDFGSTLDVTGATTLAGTTVTTLNATGAVDFDNNLNIDGNLTGGSDNTVDITDALSVGGALDITGDFAVNTNMFTVDAATGNTVIAGTAELNGDTIIRGDGNTSGTNALEIWNGDATPLQLFAVDNAGGVTFGGGADLQEQVTITGSTDDGTTIPLVVNDWDGATASPVFSVDTDGNLIFNGASDANRILIADGTTGRFSPVTMSGEATIASNGTLTIADNAITQAKMADSSIGEPELIVNGSISDGLCLKADGTNALKWESCSGGGGGDGVGADDLADVLDDSPSDGGDGGGFDIYNISGLAVGSSVFSDGSGSGGQALEVDITGDIGAANYCDADGLNCFTASSVANASSDRIEDTGDQDTYIDTDVGDADANDSIVFYTDGNLRATIQNTGQVDIVGSATIGGSMAVDTNVLFVDAATNNNVGIGTASPVASAALDITSTTQGMLAPRMDTAQRDAIGTPATGLLVFTTDAGDNGIFQFWDGSAWVDVGDGGAQGGGLWTEDGTNDYIEYDDTLGGVRIGRVTGQPAPATDWLLDVANSVVYTTANQVGINSSTISAGLELDVTGNVGATQYCDADGLQCFTAADIATLSGGGAPDSDRIEDTGDANTYIDVDPADDDSTNSIIFQNAGTQSMIIDANGEVGIGTMADPSRSLHIALNQTSGTGILITNTDTDINAAANIELTTDAGLGMVDLTSVAGGGHLSLQSNTASGTWITSNNASGIIRFNTGGFNERARFDANGLFGINNTSPQTRLDVGGTIRIGDGSELCNAAGHEGAIRYVAASDTYQVCANSATGWEDLFATGSGAAGLWTDLGGDRIHYGSAGTEQVGIGTNNPITTLDVNGGIRVGSASGAAPNYMSMDGLRDVDAASPNDGQILVYNNASGNWETSTPSAAISSIVLNDVSNVSVAGPSDGQCLVYNLGTTTWEAGSCAAAGSLNLDDLGDVTAAGATAGQVIKFNGSNWVLADDLGGDLLFSGNLVFNANAYGAWSTNGNSTQIDTNGHTFNSIDHMGGNRYAATYGTNPNIYLAMYDFDGTDWSLVGNAFALGTYSGGTVASLSSTDIAYVHADSSNQIRRLSFDGTNWAFVGSGSPTLIGEHSLDGLDGSNIIAVSPDGVLKTYNWNGSAWVLIGNTLDVSTNNYDAYAAALDNNTIAVSFNASEEIRTYDWDGTDWSQTGNTFTAAVNIDAHTTTALNSNMIGIRSDGGGTPFLRTYVWDGSDWTLESSDLTAIDGFSADFAAADNTTIVLQTGQGGGGMRLQQYTRTAGAATIVDNDANGTLGGLFSAGNRLRVTGSSTNDGIYTVSAVTNADTLQVSETLFAAGPEAAQLSLIDSASTLDSLVDVSASTPSNGDVLVYNNSTGLWEAQSSAPSADTLSSLSCNANELARWNGTQWVCSAETDVDGSFDLQFTATGVSGGSWAATGPTSALGYDTLSYTLAITLLDSTTMAVAYRDDPANTILTTFTLSGGTWTEVGGAALDLGGAQIAMNMDRIANNSVILSVAQGASGNATAYSWNGSTWSLADASTVGGYGTAAALTNNLIAYYNNLSSNLHALSWDGSSLTDLGSINPGFSGDVYNIDQLDNDTIVLVEEGAGLTDQLHVYTWTGATWVQEGSSYTIPTEAGGYGRLFIANASSTVSIGDSNNIYTYSWNGTTWTPSGTTNAINPADGGKMVMLDSNSAWHLSDNDAIQQYDYTATVANSQIVDTNATGQLDVLLNIGDRFLVSRTSLNNRVFTVSNIPNADTLHLEENAATEGPISADITILEDLPSALDDLSDVNVAFVNDNDCLIYNVTTDEWEAGACDAAGNTSEWTDDGSGNIYNTDNGNVGIGTAGTPGHKLTVLGGSIILREDDDGNIALEMSSDNTDGWIEFKSAGSNTALISAKPSQPTYFNAGDVGIGTATPSNELHVAGDARVDNSLILGLTSGNAPTYVSPNISDDSLDWAQFTDTMTLDATTTVDMDTNTADLNFDGNTLFIDSSANSVGIGNTTPIGALHITAPTGGLGTDYTSPTATGAAIHITESGSDLYMDGNSYLISGGNYHFGITDANDLSFYTAGIQRMRINSIGNIGIGVNAGDINSNSILEIEATDKGVLLARLSTAERDAMDDSYGAAEEGMTIYNETTNTYQFWDGAAWQSFATSAGSASVLQDADPDTSINVDTASDGTANTIVFTNNSSESMRITSAGNVGIGNTTPSSTLDVTGDIEVSNYVKFAGVAGNAPTYTTPSLALDGLSDTSVASPSNNDVLTWNGTNWVAQAASGGGALDDLSDAYHDTTTDFDGNATDDDDNLAIGHLFATLDGTTPGARNTAIGATALDAITTGDENVAVGYDAGSDITTQNGVVVIGKEAGRNIGTGSTAIGHRSGDLSTGIANTFVGQFSGMTVGGGNTAVGETSLWGNASDSENNVAIGMGAGAGANWDTGDPDNSVFIGKDSGGSINNGDNNIMIGFQAGDTTTDGSNNIIIGYDIDASTATASNELNIGGTIYGDLSNDYVGIGNTTPDVALDVTGDIEYSGVITDVSDIRLKTDITPLNASDMINRIANVDTYTFRMKDDEQGRIEYGVMAQEIEKIFPELVRTADDEMQTKSVNYTGLIAPMIEATKSLKSENDALRAEIAEIKSAQADILEEVKGLSRHTGYGMEKASVQILALMLLIMMLGGGTFIVMQRRKTDKS